MKPVVLLVGLLLLQGCAVQAMSYGISAYCAVPNPMRQANRILVNTKASPNAIIVTCADEVRNVR